MNDIIDLLIGIERIKFADNNIRRETAYCHVKYLPTLHTKKFFTCVKAHHDGDYSCAFENLVLIIDRNGRIYGYMDKTPAIELTMHNLDNARDVLTLKFKLMYMVIKKLNS